MMQTIHRFILSIRERRAYVTTFLVVINVVVFLLMELTGNRESGLFLLQWGAGYPPAIDAGQYWRLFTLTFLHGDMEHLINNMLLLYLLGDNLERALGSVGYAFLYVTAGVSASAISWQMQRIVGTQHLTLGASGAIFGVLGALLAILIIHKGHLEGLSLKRLGVMVALSLYSGFTSVGIDNSAHVGGLVSGFIIAFVLYGIKRIELRKEREHTKYED